MVKTFVSNPQFLDVVLAFLDIVHLPISWTFPAKNPWVYCNFLEFEFLPLSKCTDESGSGLLLSSIWTIDFHSICFDHLKFVRGWVLCFVFPLLLCDWEKLVVLMGFQVSGTKLYFSYDMSMAKTAWLSAKAVFCHFNFRGSFYYEKKCLSTKKLEKNFKKNFDKFYAWNYPKRKINL